jgi:DNA-binding NarL/FixJ family response regulator
MLTMRIAIVCADPLMRDGLSCLVAGLSWCEARVIDRLTPAKLRGHDVAVVVVEGLDNEVVSAIEEAKRLSSMRVVAVGSKGRSSLERVADRLVPTEEGFDGLRKALRSTVASKARLNIAEPVAAYGFPRKLTPREREVARLVSQGMPNRRIASTLGIQEQSVKNLVSVVMRKLDCENRVQLALHLSSANH